MIPRFGICCSFQTDDYLLYTKLELIENEIKLLRQEMKLKKYEELENRVNSNIQPQITNLKSTLEIKTEPVHEPKHTINLENLNNQLKSLV